MFRNTILILAIAIFASFTTPAALAGSEAPLNYSAVIDGKITYRFNPRTFRANQMAIITLTGDGSTDLDIFIHDQNGNIVASSTDRADRATLRFTPRVTGKYYISVKNLGEVWNVFTLTTN